MPPESAFIVGDELPSRQRLLLAINHSQPDHVPLYLKWWSRPYLSNKDDGWRDQFERVKKTTKLGLDDTVGFEPPRAFSPDVKIKRWKEAFAGVRYPLLFKEYETSRGKLKQAVYQTEDWPHGDDIPIFTDYVVPHARSRKYLIGNINDVEALSCLFCEPTEEQLEKFQEEANQARDFANEKEVLLECGGMFGDPWARWVDGIGLIGGDALAWLCGIENAIVLAYRNPDLIHRLLDIILEWNMRYIRLVSQAGGSDVIVHRGWYESLWSPKLYQTFLAPRIRKEIELVHKMRAKFCYVMTTGIIPLLGTLKEMGVDILYGVDPIQGGADLKHVKHEVGDRICLWGGVNSAITLGQGNNQTIERAVSEAVRTLAPDGGFILSAIDQLFDDTPWANILNMIRAWRKVRSYPSSIL